MEEQFVRPLPLPTADGVTVYHPVRFVNISHVPVVISNNCWFYGISMFITEIAFCWGGGGVCMLVIM
jgi:hypothetical protein